MPRRGGPNLDYLREATARGMIERARITFCLFYLLLTVKYAVLIIELPRLLLSLSTKRYL